MTQQLYYPINAALPAYVTQTTHENHKCYKIDAQGGSLTSCMFYRFPLPQTQDINVEISLYLANFLNASGNGYEGATAQLRAIRLDGETQTVTYNNNVLITGDINKWQWEQGTWRRFSIIEQLPSGVEADFIDICIIVKAPSGFIYLRNVECHNRYERRYLMEVDGPASANGTVLVEDNYGVFVGKRTPRYTGTQNWRSLWYLRTEPISIRKGEKVSINTEMSISGTVERVAGLAGALLKFRKPDGQYPPATETIKHIFANNGTLDEIFLTGRENFIAFEDYSQVELILFITSNDYSPTTTIMQHQGVDCEIFVEPVVSND